MKSEMQSLPASNGLLTLDEDTLKSLIKLEPITDVYDVEQTPFARGKFAAVRRLVHKVTGVAYAGKFIRKRRRSMDQRQEILHEVAVLKMAGSARRIVKLLEVYETPSEMALVLELAAGGELQRMVDIQDGLDEPEAVVVMKQVLEALVFLHNQNIAHLDLKPQNMLLTRDYPDTDIVLCDFGISRIIQDGVEVKEILGTPDYVAPEILSYEPISLATDIWSVGVLAYVLLSGYSPFAGDTKQQTFCNISQCALNFPPELFDGVSPAALHFIQSTLVIDPSCRLSSEECLRHPWLTGAPLPPTAVVVTPSTTVAANNSPSSSSSSSTATNNNKANNVVDSTSNSPSPPPFICLSCSKCGGSTSCHHHHHNHLRHDMTNTVVLPDRGIIC